METLTILVAGLVGWHGLRLYYQRAHIALLAKHLSGLRLEQHMKTLTEGYTRAIHEQDETRQLQIFHTFFETERAVAEEAETLARTMQKESVKATRMGVLSLCVPYLGRFFPSLTRDFRDLLHIHAAGLRHVVENADELDAKDRAYHLSAELFLFQHSCHWFCKSRSLADARLAVRHQVQYQQALDAVSSVTRDAYMRWLQGQPAQRIL